MNRIGKALSWMRRKWLLIAILLIGYWLFGDCLGRDRWMIGEGPAPATFSRLPGVIGIRLAADAPGRLHGRVFVFREGNVVEAGAIPEPAGHTMRRDHAPSQPAETDERIRRLHMLAGSPYQLSPDGRYIAAELSSRAVASPVLQIVDLETGEHVAIVETRWDWHVGALAWAPDSRYVAVVRLKLNWGGCLIEKISYMSGHPNTMVSYSLDIFDLSGDRVATMDLVSRSVPMRTELVWGDTDLRVGSPEDRARQCDAEQRSRARRAYR